jgi:hypothetical protein
MDEQPLRESGTNWGRLCGQHLSVGDVGESWVPTVESSASESLRTRVRSLQEQVGAAGAPAHLLFLDHPFADHLFDGRLGYRGERDNPGELRGRGMAVERSGERWVPPVEVVGELVVEDPDTDLQQDVRAARGPAHLLLLDHALADQLVDRGLDERGRDGPAGLVALAVVGDRKLST